MALASEVAPEVLFKVTRVRLALLKLLMITILLPSCSPMSVSQSILHVTKTQAEPLKNSSSLSQNSKSLEEFARQVTVRIFGEPGSGSGVIIDRVGNTYTVLTCQHVVAISKNSHYKVMTADGKLHATRLKKIPTLKNVDLALVQFDSTVSYKLAKLGDSKNLAIRTPIYATGFPNYHFINRNAIEDTRKWGTKAFHFTKGEVSLVLLDRSLPKGYSLGYTNEIEQGMSGGPVFNQNGQVVGINGRLKYPMVGIEAYTFADGTKPSKEVFEKMESLSWAIPISVFRKLAR